MSSLGLDLLAILFWPGLISGALLGWFYLWLVRKLTARLQGRQGPLFYQPFYDFIKLLGKETVIPDGASRLFQWLPWISLGSTLFALALLPVPGNPMKAFPGDLIVFLYLMEMPAFCEVLAGYTTRSPYAQVSAVREAMMSLGYNLPVSGGGHCPGDPRRQFQHGCPGGHPAELDASGCGSGLFAGFTGASEE